VTIIKTTSEVGDGDGDGRRDWLAGDGGRRRSGRGRHTLSGRGARVYTAHRGWLGVVTAISAASTGVVPVIVKPPLHDTTGCQTGCTTGLTTGCIV